MDWDHALNQNIKAIGTVDADKQMFEHKVCFFHKNIHSYKKTILFVISSKD